MISIRKKQQMGFSNTWKRIQITSYRGKTLPLLIRKVIGRRKIKESIYINAMDPSQKPTQIMNLEKGKEVSPCWNEFNSVIKKVVMKKARI